MKLPDMWNEFEILLASLYIFDIFGQGITNKTRRRNIIGNNM